MKYITHSIASTTCVALNRNRIFTPATLYFCWILKLAGALTADDLEMPRVAHGPLLQEFHRSIDAAGAMRHAGDREAHFDASESGKQRELVAFAEMADAEHLAGDLGEARAKRHVVIVEHDLAEFVGVIARRHQHGGQPGRELLRLLARHLGPRVIARGGGRGREPLMPRE